jgi:glyoxylase-like metal-dependent hydrolase (beta-lactamase superfamily II)
MNIRKISNNTTAYIFNSIENYTTNVYFIEKESRIYLIDTFCGSDSMVPILNRINTNSKKKEVIVINTHFHWDHVWGNCSFKENSIFGHEKCRELLEINWDIQINKNQKYILGMVEKCLPNISFKDKVIFHNDGIELFYSPGHTKDSISIFDHEEKILYAGDNLEKPIIYVESDDVSAYINTLENYIKYCPLKIVASHTLNITEEDIFDTIEYLKGLSCGEKMYFETEYQTQIHRQNLDTVHKLKEYENK